MPEYCSCGAQLPPDARFCHKCGRPQFDYPEPEAAAPPPVLAAAAVSPGPQEISFRNRTAVRTGLTVALVAFLLIPIPLPPALEIIWLLLSPLVAGFAAAFIYRRRTGKNLGIESGARIGWITGIFEFTLMLVLFCVSIVSITSQNGGMAGFLKEYGGKMPNADQMIQAAEDPTTMIGFLLISVVLLFFTFTLLPMVGGALCAKMLDKQALGKD